MNLPGDEGFWTPTSIECGGQMVAVRSLENPMPLDGDLYVTLVPVHLADERVWEFGLGTRRMVRVI